MPSSNANQIDTMPQDQISDEIDFDSIRKSTFSEGFTFDGKPLEKFSPMRKRLFHEIRASQDAPGLGSADAMEADAQRLLWLCLQPKARLERFICGLDLPGPREAPKMARMQLAIDEWADANESALSEKDALGQNVAIETFSTIWMQQAATLATPDNAGDSEAEGNGHGRKNRPL